MGKFFHFLISTIHKTNEKLFSTSRIKRYSIFLLILFCAVIIFPNRSLLQITFIFLFVFLFFYFNLRHEQTRKKIVQSKNNRLIANIDEYERIIELHKIENHENKNQLRIIENMLSNSNNEEAKAYIRSLIQEKTKQNHSLLEQVKDIPNSGLRAIIYTKLATLKNEFAVDLIVSRTIHAKIFDELKPSLNVAICKILGVFLDNAIESAKKTEQKLIGVDLFCEENQVYIKVSNSFYGNIDAEKIGKEKYTTKGEGHGYGLSLVKNIIHHHGQLKNHITISGNIFSQILIIDLD